MKWVYICLLGSLWLAPLLMHAQDSTRVEKPSIATYLRDLEELGYCVIPNVLADAEVEELYNRVWHEFIEKAWPKCRLDDRSNWHETFPMHNKMGIFSGPAGQIQPMWDLRQDPRIVDIFARVWKTEELIVSMDGLSLMCPVEIRESDLAPWPHVDQRVVPEENVTYAPGLNSQLSMIQGQFLFEDSFEGDGGFYCIPKSHLRFNEFAPHLEEIFNTPDMTPKEKWKAHNDYLTAFFSSEVDEWGRPYQGKQIVAPRGSLILWDSRTVHWGGWAHKDRPLIDNPKMRMVGYLTYVPKSRMTPEEQALRKKAFENGITAAGNTLKYTKDYMDPEFEGYLENTHYQQPEIHLNPLGQSLLGFER